MASLRSANVCRTASSSLLSLTQSLTTPNKLVHLFDWKKATSNVLVVRITKQSMECAIASHPTTLVKRDTSSSSIQSFTSIPLQRDSSISSSSGTSSDHQISSASSSPASFNVSMVTQSLQQLMKVQKEHHVCGVIVLYPTTGPIGMKNASCGRTLHVLDHIQLPLMNAVSSTGSALRNTTKTTTTSSTSSTTKPICLYDPNHYQTDMMEDEWGRTPLYSRSTAPTSSSTSKSNEKVMVRCGQIAQSDTNSHTILEQTWKNFCHRYWPSSSDMEESDNSVNDDVLLTNFMNKVSHQKNHFQMNHQQQQHHHQHHNNIDNTATVSPVYQSAF